MKKYLVICAAIAVVSCSKKETNSDMDTNVMLEESVVKTVESATVSKHEGLALIEGADCVTCHKVDARLVGPSYQEVADKYTESDLEMLANKIIEGSNGVWGDIPMTPHTGMSKENAKKMVEYILTLKK